MAGQTQYGSRARRALPPANVGQDRAVASDAQEPHLARPRSTHSSITTTIAAITRAWVISHRLTSTLDAPKPSCWNEKGSNETQSEIAACNTKERRVKSAVR